MAAYQTPINFSKVSGVIRVTTQGGLPKSYFTPRGKFTCTGNGNYVHIQINEDEFNIDYQNMQINGQTPTSLQNCDVLLTALFGS